MHHHPPHLPTDAAPPEKRRAERRPLSGRPTNLYRRTDRGIGEPLTVELVDFSPHGAGYLFPAHAPTDPGQQFLYPLYQRAGAEVYMLYTVVRAAPHPQGQRVGCELTCILPTQQWTADS